MCNHDQFDLEAMKQAVNYNASIGKRICDVLSGSKEIVDLGAGRGEFASIVYAKTGKKPICVEIDGNSIPHLKAGSFDVHQTAETIHTRFDGIYSINVLEHIEDPSSLLAAYAQKLEEGGTAFIYVPALPSLYSLWDVRVGHYHRFTKQSLEAVVKSSGLQVIKSGYTDPFGAVITFAMKHLKMGSKPLSPMSVYIYDRFVFPISRHLEFLFGGIYGKNVWVIASKPDKNLSVAKVIQNPSNNG